MYAKNTTVSPENSRAEIEKTLNRYGADAFSYGYDGDRQVVAFRAHGRYVRLELRIPPLSDFAHDRYTRTAAQQKASQQKAVRQRWRALLLVIKAKLESVESGIETFDEAFMPHILLPDKTTAGEWLGPQIERAYATGDMPDLLPAARPQLESGD